MRTSIGGKYQGQVSGAANQGPSSFKVADYVPPEILHDIPLFEMALMLLRKHSFEIRASKIKNVVVAIVFPL